MGRRASSAEQIDDEGDGRQVREKKKNFEEEERRKKRERERMKCLFNERRERSFFFVFFLASSYSTQSKIAAHCNSEAKIFSYIFIIVEPFLYLVKLKYQYNYLTSLLLVLL